MFSHACDPTDHPPRPLHLNRLGGPVLLRVVIAKTLALHGVPVDLAPANPVDDPPPELPRAA